MKQSIAPPTDAGKQAFVDGLRSGLSLREAAARTRTTRGSFNLERRRDLAFAVAVDDALTTRRGNGRSHVDRLIDVAVTYLTTGERARLAAEIQHWAGEVA